jgi:hypothetical protein
MVIRERKNTTTHLKSPFRYYDSDLRPKEFKAKVPMNDEHLKKTLQFKTGQKKDRLIYFRDMFYFKCMNGSRMSDIFF